MLPAANLIAAAPLILMDKALANAARGRTARAFFDFALGASSEYASRLGNDPLPEPLMQWG